MWEPPRHEPIRDDVWDESRARAAIATLAKHAERERGPDGQWPSHPDDDQVGGARTGVYFGTAGVCWAFDHLAQRGFADAPATPWLKTTGGLLDLYAASPETGEPTPSYFLGEVGLRLVLDAGHERIFELVEGNIENPSLEILWGAPGTMIAAEVLFRRTAEARWRDLWLRNARYLMSRLEHHDDVGCRLWTQDLYGEVVRLIGAGHGFAGNARSLLVGADLLDESERTELVTAARDTLVRTAIRRDGLANWSPHAGRPRRGREAILVQWCHGAPGMLTSLAALPVDDPELEQVLLEAGELVWAAGPLTKGYGLCHGTAGNGYALLSLFERTGDAVWLDRARRFGMHALRQMQARREHHGAGRWNLYNGDPGLACFLADCRDGSAGLPLLDKM